jgi:ABC-type phosphate transport system substrate-binding protein
MALSGGPGHNRDKEDGMRNHIVLCIGLALAGPLAAGETELAEAPTPEEMPAPPAQSCSLCGPTFRGGKTLSIQGSTTLRPIVDRVNQTVQIQDGIAVTGRNLGSTTGIRCVIEGECERRGTWTALGPCDMGNDGLVGTGDGPCDIGISSRPATATELNVANVNGLCLVEHPVAIDGLGLIVNNDPACAASFPLLAGQGLGDYLVANLPGPPLGGLSETQIKEALFGNDPATLSGSTVLFQQWCDLVGCANGALPNLTIVSRQEEGGTYGAFLDLYVCNTLDGTARPTVCSSAAQFPLNTGSAVDPFEWLRRPSSCTPTACGANDPPVVDPLQGTSPTQFVGSNDEVVAAVAGTCGAVGYAGISFIDTAIAAGAKIKSFPVTQTLAQPPVAASFATTLDGTFDFARKLYAYTVGSPTGRDPRAAYLDTLSSRLGQANAYEGGFVPFNGVRPRSAGEGTAAHVQVVLEPIGKDLIRTSSERIAGKLALVQRAESILADPGATQLEKRDATTDLVESEFSIRETVDADDALVARRMGRVDGCLAAATCDDPGRAARELDRAVDSFARAQAMLVPDDPTTPVDEFIQRSDFDAYVRELGRAFDRAGKADQACNRR